MFLAAEQSQKPWLLEQRSQRRWQYLSDREERAQPLHWRKRQRQEGSANLIKEKEWRGRGIEDEGQKKEAVHSTHGQRREAWKTVESCGVTESGYLKYRYADCH